MISPLSKKVGCASTFSFDGKIYQKVTTKKQRRTYYFMLPHLHNLTDPGVQLLSRVHGEISFCLSTFDIPMPTVFFLTGYHWGEPLRLQEIKNKEKDVIQEHLHLLSEFCLLWSKKKKKISSFNIPTVYISLLQATIGKNLYGCKKWKEDKSKMSKFSQQVSNKKFRALHIGLHIYSSCGDLANFKVPTYSTYGV